LNYQLYVVLIDIRRRISTDEFSSAVNWNGLVVMMMIICDKPANCIGYMQAASSI